MSAEPDCGPGVDSHHRFGFEQAEEPSRTSAAAPASTGKTRLSKATILTTARVIADEYGLPAVTLRRLASELGTGQASLYRHIADRRELLVMLVEGVVLEYPLGDETLSPRERLTEQWVGLFVHLARHRWAAQVIVDGTLTSPNAAPFVQRQLEDLRATGMEPHEAALAYRSLFNLLLGFLLNDHPMGHDLPELFDVDDRLVGFRWAMGRLLATLPS